MHSIFNQITKKTFLDDYWCKKPLLFKNAFPDFQSPISGDELAGLACEAEVESRMVFTEKDNKPWQLENGPFDEEKFATLPQSHWTLLVQGVDHWNTELSDLLDNFRFIPNWMVDDIMASFSPEGGSVGPHFDEYNVFLLQAEGTREWKIGQYCDHEMDCLEDTPLRIIKDFSETERFILTPGDMLYLPPRLAHYGISQGNGITLSIGFRSPSVEEILQGVNKQAIENLESGQHLDSFVNQNLPNGEIANQTLEHIKSLVAEHLLQQDFITSWFGKYSTEPKFEGIVEPLQDEYSEVQVGKNINNSKPLAWNEGSRFTYSRSQQDEKLTLFVDGDEYSLAPEYHSFCVLLCNTRKIDTAEIAKTVANQQKTINCQLADNLLISLLTKLINKGSLYFE